MFEIELKAHVQNRTAVVHQLDLIAVPSGAVFKDDTYWALPDSEKKIRIRKETVTSHETTVIDEKISPEHTIYLTYKKKELRNETEINDEQECIITDEKPLESFFTDSGFIPVLHKQKKVVSWYKKTSYGNAHIELCTLAPLGDFLEIEILSETQEQTLISAIQTELKKIMFQAGISESDIESRYYSEMLAQIQEPR